MPSLLLVDDDETLVEVLFELLLSREYDLVVTDISMPGMSGESLLGFIKTNSPGTPIIFISGSKDGELAQRLRVKGAAGFLSKPFDLAEITEKVAQALEGRLRSKSLPH